jgi:lipid II:glycine glycyltransferase (peptidoglycan interpeptide bridge formation enzyme)
LDIQPPDTVILSLEGDDEVLLGAMKPKTRYNIRLAEKKGVLVRCGTVEELSLWYELYRETAERDGIGLHEYGYYRRLFDLAETYSGKKPLLRLLLATAEEKLLAGIIVAVFDEHAFYLYGASSNEMRNYMASYLLQWRAMVLAKSLGARDYDLFGIPPRDDPGHAMYGLFRFKTGFGGTFLHRPGSYDFPFKYFAYLGYRGAEGIRKWYHKSWAKRLVKRRF